MVVLTAEQMKQAEEQASQNGLSYLRMMDNAGSFAARRIQTKYPAAQQGLTVVLCGCGNNGGDGFVVARRLAEKQMKVVVVLVCGAPRTDCAVEMYERLRSLNVMVVDGQTEITFARNLIAESVLVVDGVFGTGFHGQLPGCAKELLGYSMQMKKTMVALDLPSGVNADNGEIADGTPTCQTTVSFHAYKYGHILYPGAACCGEILVGDIGIAWHPSCAPLVIDRAFVAERLVRVQGDTHKGTYGKAALLVGSKGMSGAASLSVAACLRCGVGLAIPIVPNEIYPLVASSATEGVYRIYQPSDQPASVVQLGMDASAMLVGCGLGNTPFTSRVCYGVAEQYNGPLVLDADGINSLLLHMDVLKKREGATVLTPHPVEMARIMRQDVSLVQADRFGAARQVADTYGAVTVLKGAGTVIASPDGRMAVNLTGNSGLSKGGSGDVLAGMLVSLLAQGVEPFDAACTAVWLHGKAGEMVSSRLSQRAMLPGDLVQVLPSLFLEFEE